MLKSGQRPERSYNHKILEVIEKDIENIKKAEEDHLRIQGLAFILQLATQIVEVLMSIEEEIVGHILIVENEVELHEEINRVCRFHQRRKMKRSKSMMNTGEREPNR